MECAISGGACELPETPVAPELPKCLPPCLQRERLKPGEQRSPEYGKELGRQAPWLPRLACFPLLGDTVTRPQSSSGLVGKALDKESCFSDSMSVTGANHHCPHAGVTPRPPPGPKESRCVLEILSLRLNPVHNDRERRCS